jgi:hypothetical protein
MRLVDVIVLIALMTIGLYIVRFLMLLMLVGRGVNPNCRRLGEVLGGNSLLIKIKKKLKKI